ncbi:ankyrin repeat-containing domain protein [Xylaria intraflava]|nr:ankyrin repeat-containing domain protein [Xylaria intraflava]
MHYAAENGHEENVQVLVEVTDVDKQDRFGRTALHWAVENGHLQIVKLLEGKKANLNSQDSSGQTALSRAAWRGYTETVDFLLAQGAAHYIIDKNGKTALHLATEGERHKGGAKSLFIKSIEDETHDISDSLSEAVLERFVNDIARNINGGMICLAARREHKKWAQLLFTKTINVDGRFEDIKLWTALQTVSEEGALEAVNRLLKAGADPNADPAEKSGRTALQAAAEGGHLEVVNRLLEVGADVNAPATHGGRTALQAAAEGGHLEVVARLKEAGAVEIAV